MVGKKEKFGPMWEILRKNRPGRTDTLAESSQLEQAKDTSVYSLSQSLRETQPSSRNHTDHTNNQPIVGDSGHAQKEAA